MVLPSSTYVDSTPFNATDGSGYTNYIYPVAQSFSITATKGADMVTQADNRQPRVFLQLRFSFLLLLHVRFAPVEPLF